MIKHFADMSKTKRLFVFLIIAVASLSVYSHYTCKAREEAQHISERARHIKNILNRFATDADHDEEQSYLMLLSEIYALSVNAEFQSRIHSSQRVWDALIVRKEDVFANAEELMEIYALIEIDYRNPVIQDRLNRVLGVIFT
jgi:superfamily I DNA and RNA helicase